MGALLVVVELLDVVPPDPQAAREIENSTEAVTRAIGVRFIATLPFFISSENG
jgi:hypothetical protein